MGASPYSPIHGRRRDTRYRRTPRSAPCARRSLRPGRIRPAPATADRRPSGSSRWAPQHNDADYAAWTLVDGAHPGDPWVREHAAGRTRCRWRRTPATCAMHADHFERRVGFTYTVRSTADDDVIGCVYIYPSDDPSIDARCARGSGRPTPSSTPSCGAACQRLAAAGLAVQERSTTPLAERAPAD